MSDTESTSSSGRSRALWWLGLALVAASAYGVWRWHAGSTNPSAGLSAPPTPASAAAGPALSASQVERAASSARAAVEKDASDASAWAMLANVEMMRGNLAEAVAAYRKLLALRPQDAQAFAEAAEALAAAQGGKLAGEPARWVDHALQVAPDNLKARAMAGKAAFEERRYEQAAQHWERALATATDARARQQLEVSLAEARALQGGAAASAPARNASGAAMAYVAGRVTLADALKSRIKPEDTVYVVARPAEGSRMPVALLKRRAADLPLDFALDDTLAMVPESRLSQHKQVIVRVLISRRGDAIPASGDLLGQVGPVPVGSGGVRVEVRDVVP